MEGAYIDFQEAFAFVPLVVEKGLVRNDTRCSHTGLLARVDRVTM